VIYSPIVTTTTTPVATTTTTVARRRPRNQAARQHDDRRAGDDHAPVTTTAPATTTRRHPHRVQCSWCTRHRRPALAVGDRPPLNVNSATDMGTNDTLPDGSAAPAPVVYDIDGILTRRHRVGIARRGRHAICYIELVLPATTTLRRESTRPRTTAVQAAGPRRQAVRLSEYFLNINSPATVSITER